MAVDLSKTFIDRPIFAAVISLFILIAGAIAIPNLPVSEYPEVVPPAVQVTALYPGADPQTASETVAAPLEEAINGVENMIYMKSVAASDGTVMLTITFATGTDIDLASVLVQNRVSQALPRLPEAVRALGVTTIKSSPTLTMFVTLRSPNGTYDSLYLNNYANLRIRDELARIPGVGQVIGFGVGNYSMRVWLDPEKAASRDIAAGDIVRAIREQNVQVSAGVIGGPPQPGTGTLQLSINAQGRLASEEEFGEIVVKTASDGAITRLRDIARIELGAQTYAMRSYQDGMDSANIAIFQTPGANSIELSNAVRERMELLERDFPEDLVWSSEYDPTVFVRQSISSVITTLLEAVLLVVLVVVLFLQTWRASIIPLLAVPVSIIGTFAVLWLLGFSINVLTLFGLVLAIGIVVDDAIVVVENVERHIEDGHPPRVAAHRAMEEVSGPIVAISLVLASVFVPLTFLGGITGEFYRQFAVTIAASVLISGLNSLTLSPAMAAILLKPRGAPNGVVGNTIEFLLGWIFRPFNRVFDRGATFYSRNVGANVRRCGRLVVIYSLLIGIALFAFRAVPPGFVPQQDKQYLFGIVLLPEGATIDRTDAVAREVERIGREIPGIEHSFSLPGLNAVHFVTTPNMATVFFTLTPEDEREATAAELASDLSFRLSSLKEGFAFALMPPPVFGLSNTSGLEMY
ncbi:MAG TPA: efflux RND transporter permease subunit, partial [Gammaproteobacteria bacterium]